jgi:pimeloyl-ACP methyl ester carboxylesterase
MALARPSTVVFNHGKESGPWGSKIQALAEVAKRHGLHAESIDYQADADPDSRVEKLIQHEQTRRGQILVGSSMGAYVATVASVTLSPAGLFLLAPAFFIPGYRVQDPAPSAFLTTLVHGWGDDVVPIDHSIRFARKHRVTLHAIDGDHRLNARIKEVCVLFETFLQTFPS